MVEIDAIHACIEKRGQASGAQDLCAIATGGSNGGAHATASSIAEKGYGGVEHLHALPCQKLQEIVIFALGETMNGLLFRRVPGLPRGHLDTTSREEAQHTRDARFAIDIAGR